MQDIYANESRDEDRLTTVLSAEAKATLIKKIHQMYS